MKVYPSWRYHSTLEPKVVFSAEEDAALGKAWADTPAAFDKPVEAPIVSDDVYLESFEPKSKKAPRRAKA